MSYNRGMWEALGRLRAQAVVEARLQAHWAVQAIAAAGDGWIERRADDSHTAMTWDGQRLVGAVASSGLAIGLAVDSLTLVALRGGEAVASLPLVERTLADAVAWADAQHAAAAGAPIRGIAVRSYDMPEHPIRNGATFTADRASLGELAAWYAIGAEVLRDVAAEPGAAPLLVWPHHFDLGTIVFLDPPGEHARQIGAGMSPGDGSYAEPYFYVTPYPIPEGVQWPALAGGGIWRRQGWTGAVLTRSVLVAVGDAPTRRTRAHEFVRSAIAGSRHVIASSAK
jgi:hypothetical protein